MKKATKFKSPEKTKEIISKLKAVGILHQEKDVLVVDSKFRSQVEEHCIRLSPLPDDYNADDVLCCSILATILKWTGSIQDTKETLIELIEAVNCIFVVVVGRMPVPNV